MSEFNMPEGAHDSQHETGSIEDPPETSCTCVGPGWVHNAGQWVKCWQCNQPGKLRCECGATITSEDLERVKRFGIKADPRGHVHNFQEVSA